MHLARKKVIFILITVSIGITSWMPTARIVRGDVLALKEREFVLAARSIGTTNTRLILRHILPNVMSPIMVSATLGIANAIITESALSFLGLGFPPDFPTWGRLLNDATDYLQQYPERVFWPGAGNFSYRSQRQLSRGWVARCLGSAHPRPVNGTSMRPTVWPTNRCADQIFLRIRRTAIHTNATTGTVIKELSIVLLTPATAAKG